MVKLSEVIETAEELEASPTLTKIVDNLIDLNNSIGWLMDKMNKLQWRLDLVEGVLTQQIADQQRRLEKIEQIQRHQ